MSGFSIDLDNKDYEYEGDMVVSGSMKIGEFNECFHASLSHWDRNRYQSQWKDALSRLINGETSSAVVTAMNNPSTANFIFWWVMYLIGDGVHIQNHVLFLNELEQPFDETDLYSFIPEREIQTEEGEPISEWVVDLSSIKRFVDSLQ